MSEHPFQRVALPFTLRRGHDAITAAAVTSTSELALALAARAVGPGEGPPSLGPG